MTEKPWLASIRRKDGSRRETRIAAPTDFFCEPVSSRDLRWRRFAKSSVDVDSLYVVYDEIGVEE